MVRSSSARAKLRVVTLCLWVVRLVTFGGIVALIIGVVLEAPLEHLMDRDTPAQAAAALPGRRGRLTHEHVTQYLQQGWTFVDDVLSEQLIVQARRDAFALDYRFESVAWAFAHMHMYIPTPTPKPTRSQSRKDRR